MSEVEKKLRVWHIINFPREPFHFDVPNVDAAIRALKALARYDLFLGDGEDKPWTTVGGRAHKQQELAGKDQDLQSMFRLYNLYQIKHSPGGVPFVGSNAQGLEVFEDDEWCEFYDEEGRDIQELEELQSKSPAA